jgi:membrane protein implicated in regulation of membrane protease activity
MTEPLWQLWWVWMSAALVMVTLEVLVPGYIFLGFAIGAFALGLLVLLGLSGLGLPVSLVIFAVLSLLAYLVLRRVLGLKEGQVKIWHRDVND